MAGSAAARSKWDTRVLAHVPPPGYPALLWESGPAEAPDGFALAQSGNVYMAYFTGDQTHWVLFDVFAGEQGAPAYVPAT